MLSALAERAEALVGPVLDDGALGAFSAGVTARCAGRRLLTAGHTEPAIRTFASRLKQIIDN
jgi:hypothetical protein